MMPFAVYPVPETTVLTVVLLFIAGSAAIALYLLVYRPTGGQPMWWIGEMVAVTVLFLFTLPLATLLIGIELPLTLSDLTIVMVLQNALLVGAPAYVAAVRYRRRAATLGLRSDGWPRRALLGLVAAAVALPLVLAGERAAVFVMGLIEGPAQAAARAAAEHLQDPLRPLLDEVTGWPGVAWLLVLLAIVVPIGEEVFFRGFVYGGLRARWGVLAAAVVSAAFFAAVHRQLIHGLPIFLLGVLLALLYERTRSLIPAIVTHAASNVIAVLSVWRGWGL